MTSEMLQPLLIKLLFVVVLALLDMVGGAVLAWKAGTFDWECVPNFLKTFFPFMFGWALLEGVGLMPALLDLGASEAAWWERVSVMFAGYTGDGAFALILLKYGASTKRHVQTIFAKGGEI